MVAVQQDTLSWDRLAQMYWQVQADVAARVDNKFDGFKISVYRIRPDHVRIDVYKEKEG